MDFLPKSNWQWFFDKQTDLLTLQMGDSHIEIVYKSNMLVIFDDKPIPFTIEDVARYTQLFEGSALKAHKDDFARKIILHILAIELFHKPIMPKSWLFADSESQISTLLEPMTAISLSSKNTHESARYLVLEDDQEFALCLLIDHVHQITPRKSLPQFQIVKLTLDKLNLVKTTVESSWHSYQIA